MKKLIGIALLSLSVHSANINASALNSNIYVNKNIGFNVEGFKYQQPAYPCNVDTNLVDLLIKESKRAGLQMESVETKEKIQNGVTPVLLIDIEQLTLRKNINYGNSKNFNLPKIQITAGLLLGEDLQTAKHTCVSAAQDKLMLPTDRVVLNNENILVCEEAKRCLVDLSKDVVSWLKPQLK
ncbi:hypothetical protein [Paraglaciecola sp.]|uniref:hypothetical protein n=1 Tax=Paraglaciecola sp. TaxID=1920173 RepID=UPI003EF78BC5